MPQEAEPGLRDADTYDLWRGCSQGLQGRDAGQSRKGAKGDLLPQLESKELHCFEPGAHFHVSRMIMD